MIKTFSYSFQSLDIRPHDIEIFMGYEAGTSMDIFGTIYEAALANANELCKVEGGYRLISGAGFDDSGKELYMNEKMFHPGKIIYRQLKNISGAVLFLCTAGAGISRVSQELLTGNDQLLGYVYDVIGSICVEKAIDRMQDNLELELAQSGIGMTNRFSPGYCEWDVAEQQTLFSFFPKDFCGISLSPTSLMNPIKSVSGIIGFGPDIEKKEHPCKLCTMTGCFKKSIITQ